MKTHLFLGGPLDGRRFSVPDGEPHTAINGEIYQRVCLKGMLYETVFTHDVRWRASKIVLHLLNNYSDQLK